MCYNNDKCQNGGTCREDIPNHSFTCDCPPGTSGDYCDTGALSRDSSTAIKFKSNWLHEKTETSICLFVTLMDFGRDVSLKMAAMTSFHEKPPTLCAELGKLLAHV